MKQLEYLGTSHRAQNYLADRTTTRKLVEDLGLAAEEPDFGVLRVEVVHRESRFIPYRPIV